MYYCCYYSKYNNIIIIKKKRSSFLFYLLLAYYSIIIFFIIIYLYYYYTGKSIIIIKQYEVNITHHFILYTPRISTIIIIDRKIGCGGGCHYSSYETCEVVGNMTSLLCGQKDDGENINIEPHLKKKSPANEVSVYIGNHTTKSE